MAAKLEGPETNQKKKAKGREDRVRRAIASEQLAALLTRYPHITSGLVEIAVDYADLLIAKLRTEGGS